MLIAMHDLDILLISETHLTDKHLVRIRNFNIYRTDHPDGTAHGGAAIIIKNSIKHHHLCKFQTNEIQAATVTVEDKNGCFNISAVYCPPKHKFTSGLLRAYFATLEKRFISGGDWNAKHVHWGSRLTTTRGRVLKSSMEDNSLISFSPTEPTHWPTESYKLPDIIDFFVSKGLSKYSFTAATCLDGSSNHVPVILQMSTRVLLQDKATPLYNRQTDWD